MQTIINLTYDESITLGKAENVSVKKNRDNKFAKVKRNLRHNKEKKQKVLILFDYRSRCISSVVCNPNVKDFGIENGVFI